MAYWVCNQYPYAMTGYQFTAPEWHRVPAWGAITGRPNVLHLFEPERAEQRRGVPLLAPVIEELQQLKRYEEAELMAAVISSFFTVFVTTEGLTTQLPLGESLPEGTPPIPTGDNEYQMGNGAIVTLAPGEKVEIADPKRPNSAFDGFVDAVSKTIGAGLEIPADLLLKKFNASYSASRAALLEAWKRFKASREWLAREFCQPVYELFLTEAVARDGLRPRAFWKTRCSAGPGVALIGTALPRGCWTPPRKSRRPSSGWKTGSLLVRKKPSASPEATSSRMPNS